MARVTLAGFVTGEPKLRFTRVDKTPVTHVRIGCTTRKLRDRWWLA